MTLVEAQPRILMRGVPEEIARVVHARHVEAGVTMEVGTALKAVETDGVRLADGRKVKAEIVVAGIGAAPEIALAQTAGLAIENGIACDATLRTSDPDIYAAGDCCSFPHGLFGDKRMRLEAWRNATDQANVATENMLGGSKPYMAVPWFWSDQYDLSLQIAGNPAEGAETVQAADGRTGLRDVPPRPRGPPRRRLRHRARQFHRARREDGRDADRQAGGTSASSLADPTVQLKVLLKG